MQNWGLNWSLALPVLCFLCSYEEPTKEGIREDNVGNRMLQVSGGGQPDVCDMHVCDVCVCRQWVGVREKV